MAVIGTTNSLILPAAVVFITPNSYLLKRINLFFSQDQNDFFFFQNDTTWLSYNFFFLRKALYHLYNQIEEEKIFLLLFYGDYCHASWKISYYYLC